MGRRNGRSGKPTLFKKPKAPTTTHPTTKPAPSSGGPGMGSALGTGFGVGMGAAAGNAAFSTIAGAMSGGSEEPTPKPTPLPNEKTEWCNMIRTQFYDCLKRDMGNSCHDLQYLLEKGQCNN